MSEILTFIQDHLWLFIWGVIFIGTVIAELETMQLICIWFSAGSLAAFFAAVFNMPPLGQTIVFVAVSILLLLVTKPLLKKFKVDKVIPTNIDAEVGKDANVTEEINPAANTGRVRIGGVNWRARTKDGSVIPTGTIVKVTEISGTTAYVALAEQTVSV